MRIYLLLLLLLVSIHDTIADLPNPIFSELAFIVNTTDISSMYNIIYSTAISVSSQDFQAVRLTSREYTPTNVSIHYCTSCVSYTLI